MKKINILVSCLFIVGIMSAQKNFEKNALTQAKQMANEYNNQNYEKYVDFLFPTDWGKESKTLAGLGKSRTEQQDTVPFKIVRVLKSAIKENEYQALVLCKFLNKDSYVFSLSKDGGRNWLFTCPISTKLYFNMALVKIPTLDTTFSDIIDTKYGKRAYYKKGKKITPFKFTDIQGKSISSDSLKGKVIVLNFWSISCSSCIAEMPELNKLVAKMRGKDVVFIAPAVLSPKDVLINNFLPKHPFDFRVVPIDIDDYSVSVFPTLVIIDRNLKVVESSSKLSNKDLEQKIEKSLSNIN